MKGIIIYNGKYGATRQYATMLGALTSLPVVLSEDVHFENLGHYDYFILGGSVYVGRLRIARWLKANMAALIRKKLFFFIVSGTGPDEKEKMDRIVRDNLPAELRAQSEIFFLRGRMIKEKLSRKDRFVLRMGAFFTRNKKERREMLTDFDGVRTQNILPLQQSIAAYLKTRKPASKARNPVP